MKAEGGDFEPAWRERAEAEIIGCADAICVSCSEEERQFLRLYGQRPARSRSSLLASNMPSSPGDRTGARNALDLPLDCPLLLFVGRIQPLKGPDVAVRALAAMNRPDALLLIVGGASGLEGGEEMQLIDGLITELGVEGQVRFVEPQPHLLSTYYRAADVVLVPSRSESFGLVALEASACGIPVVASGVGGLLTLVDHGDTGFLVPERDPALYAQYINEILANPDRAAEMGRRGAQRARQYTWGFAAARLRRVYADLTVRELVAWRERCA